MRFNGAARFCVRKCGALTLRMMAARMLQWGRTFLRAEISRPSRGPLAERRLQWGRTFLSAEIEYQRYPAGVRWTRFNGAARFCVRKCRGGGIVRSVRRQLQWGRTFLRAEIFPGALGVVVPLCFNGAARFCVRKFCSWDFWGFRVPGLQWGRTFLRAEIGAMRAVDVARDVGFNGAARFCVRKSPDADENAIIRMGFNGAARFCVRKYPP